MNLSEAGAALPVGHSAHSERARGQLLLGLAAFGCGCSSAFGIDLLGQLFWAEILLPAVALIVLATRFPTGLFENRSFRILLFTSVLMLVGYMISDIAASTPSEMYLRGWARVVAFGTSAFSLCVICYTDRRCLLWFCIGMAAGGIAAGWIAGVPLTRWKLGYGESAALLAAASGAVLPLWLASITLVVLGGISVLLDYRSLGVLLMFVATAVFLRRSRVDLRRLWRSLPLLVVAFGAVAVAALWLLNASAEDNQQRRSASNLGRFAALHVGTVAILDSPILGYGSWGQGTEKYAAMLYEETISESIAGDAGNIHQRGRSFTAHSQLIQAWMEGGVLAAAFFVAYIIMLARSLARCMFSRPPDYLTPLLLFVVSTNLWAAIMSPFLGSQRISVAMAVSAIVVLATERRTSAHEQVEARYPGPQRPVNLMS